MTLKQLKSALKEHIYMEDEDVVDVVMAATISNILRLGQPVWLVLIGAPSSGKTQYILPLEHSQPEGDRTIHQVTDLTPNTFLSGFRAGASEPSLLKRIGENGILLFPDLTSLFSKEPQVLHEILGQLRHVYDGYLTKHTGNQEPIEWHGNIGIMGASTPSLYTHFSDIADMGERFMYYRLKPFNRDKATDKSLNRSLYGKELDQHIGGLYSQYLSSVLQATHTPPKVKDEDNDTIKEMAKFASTIRTSVHTNLRTGEVDRIPEPEMPMRTALQLRGLALGMMVMNEYETKKPSLLTPANIRALQWCAYSLADDERRKTIQTLAEYPAGATSAGIAMALDLPTSSTYKYLQHLNALKLVRRSKGTSNADLWHMTDESTAEFVRTLTGIEKKDEVFVDPNERSDDRYDPEALW